jgi:hypothetical protein
MAVWKLDVGRFLLKLIVHTDIKKCLKHPLFGLGIYGGEWSASRPGRALALWKGPLVPIVQEAGWAPEPIWTQAREKIVSPLPGIEPQSPGHPAHSQTLY